MNAECWQPDAEQAEIVKHWSGILHCVRGLPDGRLIGIYRLMYTWALVVDIDYNMYNDRYCYSTLAGAQKAFDEWDGSGEPQGWHRHPATGRRKDLVTGREWIAK